MPSFHPADPAAPRRRRGVGPHLGMSARAAAKGWPAWVAVSCLLALAIGVSEARGAQKFSEEGGYAFHLRNGSRIHTPEYWEEGNDYRIERFGGVIGLNKGDVLRIERAQTATTTPAPAAAQPAAAEAARPDASQGILAQIETYVAELITWLRGWLARISGTRRAAETAQTGAGPRVAAAPAQAGGPAAARAPGGSPILVPLIALLVVVPVFLFGGKALGTRLFGAQHA